MRLCKLDAYDYMVLPGVIRIFIDATNDPILVDILSEISKANGNIYVEGRYYFYMDSNSVYSDETESYMDLQVVEIS